MSLCASCGLAAPEGLCPHHATAYVGDEWAAVNRVMCDFVHRHIVPARLMEDERSEITYAGIG